MGHARLTPPDPSADLTAGTVAALFCEHHGELVRLALLLVGNLPTAEDVVQDVYASLHTRWTPIAASEAILSYVRAAVLKQMLHLLAVKQPLYPAPV